MRNRQMLAAAAVMLAPSYGLAAPRHTTPNSSAAPYAMHGVRLGISLADFKALPPPTDGKYVNAGVSCDDAPKVVDDMPPATVCEWDGVYQSHNPELAALDHSAQMEVSYGLSSAYPKFWFTKDTDGVEKLYQITLVANIDKWDLIYPSMEEKFGRPQIQRLEARNGLGMPLPAMVARWRNGSSSLQAQKVCLGEAEAMCVTYALNRLNLLQAGSLKPKF